MTGWPFPGDRAVDRARQVAQQYRAALVAVDPDTCAAIDRAAEQVGETWVLPQVAQHDDTDLVTVTEAAELTGRSVRWVYAWAAEDPGRIQRRRPRILVQVGDVRRAAARSS